MAIRCNVLNGNKMGTKPNIFITRFGGCAVVSGCSGCSLLCLFKARRPYHICVGGDRFGCGCA